MEPFLTKLSPEDAEILRKDIAHRIFHRPLANTRRRATFDRRGRRSTKEPDDEES
jgi:hypothetical protein